MKYLNFNINIQIIGRQRRHQGDLFAHSVNEQHVDIRQDENRLASLLRAFPYFKRWQDPYSGRTMTRGEYGCSLSHRDAWLFASKSEFPTLIIEEDAYPLLRIEDIREDLKSALHESDVPRVVYLSQKAHGMGIPYGRQLYHETEHPLWTLAYFVTPNGASNLLTTLEGNVQIIPADDLLPALMGLHRDPAVNALWDEHRRPVECLSTMQRYFGSQTGSEASTTECGPYMVSMATIHPDFKTCTYVTNYEHPGFERMQLSALRYGYGVGLLASINDGDEDDPHWSTDAEGGIQKMKAMSMHLSRRDPDQVILFVDGYDVIFQAHANDLYRYWKTFAEEKIMVAGERTCWPNADMAETLQEVFQSWYPNSGVIMGKIGDIGKYLLDGVMDTDEIDDQAWLHKKMLESHDKFFIADESVIVCLNHNPTTLEVDEGRGQLMLRGDTVDWPYVVHANGPTKDLLDGELAAIGGRIRDNYGNIGEKDRKAYFGYREEPVEENELTENMFRMERGMKYSVATEVRTVGGIHMVRDKPGAGWTQLEGA